METGSIASSPYNGWLILDKPLELSSNDTLYKVKKAIGKHKMGHAGTLDPLASGILPVALGEATKTVRLMMDATKEYCFSVTFGEQRSTDDCEGEVIAATDFLPDAVSIHAMLPIFTGEINQVPPSYSAIKVGGKRAYALARQGEEVTLPPRKITIHQLELLSYNGKEAVFRMECGKGTYIRSFARDLALKLGSLGYISALRRTRVGKFSEKLAISVDKLQEIVHNRALQTILLPVDTVLDDIPVLILTPDEVTRVRYGQAIVAQGFREENLIAGIADRKLIALGNVHQGIYKPERVFNY